MNLRFQMYEEFILSYSVHIAKFAFYLVRTHMPASSRMLINPSHFFCGICLCSYFHSSSLTFSRPPDLPRISDNDGSGGFNSTPKRIRKSVHLEGPSFITLPDISGRGQIEFYNSSGIVLACRARGSPQPQIAWIIGHSELTHVHSTPMNGDGSAVQMVGDIPGVRYTRSDGALVIQPFAGHQYRQDVHSTSYRCMASNAVGSIISGEIRVHAGKPITTWR